MIIAPGATSRSITVYAYDATTGLAYTTAAYNDGGIALWYRRGGVGAKTTITPATLSALTDAWSSGGFKAIAENAIRLDLPDAALAAGVTEVEVGGSATAWKLISMTIQLETPQTGDSFARLGADGAGLTAVPWNAAWDAEVQSEAADALTAYAPATVGAAMTLAPGAITAAVVATGAIDADALAADAVAEIADGVWDEALAGHATAGTTGKALSDAGAAGDPWEAAIEGETFTDGTAGDILQGLAGGTVYAIGSTPNTDAALSIRNADTVAVPIGDLTGLSAGWDSLLVTIKKSKHDPDSAAILQVRLNVATPTLPGIVYINGQGAVAAGVLATDAWISDVDAGGDTLVLNIKPAASQILPVRGALWWNVKQLDGTTWTSLATGEESAEITPGITQAIS